MRYLTIVRHGKADDPARFGDDRQRPLTDKGAKDVRSTARFLENLQPPIDWWVTSPAARARETTDVLVDALGSKAPVRQEDDVYPGDAGRLLELLATTPPEMNHVAVIGHNPVLEELVAGLCAGNSALNFRLPTAAVAHLELEVSHWEQVRWGCGSLRLLIAPKLVKKP